MLVHRAARDEPLAPPTGPVFLSLPGDVLNERRRYRVARARVASLPQVRGDLDAVNAAAEVARQEPSAR